MDGKILERILECASITTLLKERMISQDFFYQHQIHWIFFSTHTSLQTFKARLGGASKGAISLEILGSKKIGCGGSCKLFVFCKIGWSLHIEWFVDSTFLVDLRV